VAFFIIITSLILVRRYKISGAAVAESTSEKMGLSEIDGVS